MFFGKILKEGQTYAFNPTQAQQTQGEILSITNVVLAPTSPAPAALYIKKDHEEYLIANLTKDKPHVSLNVFISLLDQVSLFVKGNGTVHITGFFQPDQQGDFLENGNLPSDQDEEQEYSEQKAPVKTAQPAKQQTPAPSVKNVASSQQKPQSPTQKPQAPGSKPNGKPVAQKVPEPQQDDDQDLEQDQQLDEDLSDDQDLDDDLDQEEQKPAQKSQIQAKSQQNHNQGQKPQFNNNKGSRQQQGNKNEKNKSNNNFKNSNEGGSNFNNNNKAGSNFNNNNKAGSNFNNNNKGGKPFNKGGKPFNKH